MKKVQPGFTAAELLIYLNKKLIQLDEFNNLKDSYLLDIF